MTKLFKRVAVGMLFAVASAVSYATTCDDALTSYASCAASPSCAAGTTLTNLTTNHPECFAGSSTSSTKQIGATSFAHVNAISRALSSRFTDSAPGPVASNQDQKGLAAGGQLQAWNVWGNVDQNDSDTGYTTPNGNKFSGSGDILTTVIGADYALSSQMVFGVSAAFDNGNAWGLSSGSTTGKNSTDTNGYLIAPYLGYQLSKDLALDVSAGIGSGDFSATGGVKANADRWFAAANLSYSRWMDNLQLTGKFSYMHGEEDYGNSKAAGVTITGSGSTNEIDRINLGVQAGYWMNGFMPYAGLAYTSNVGRSSSIGNSDPLGRDAFVLSLGANFFSLSSKVSGGLRYEEELNRSNSDNRVLAANVNFRF